MGTGFFGCTHSAFKVTGIVQSIKDTDDGNTVIDRAVDEFSYYIIGIVTSDTTSSTELFLERMEITSYVSFLRTKDSPTHKKPNPEAIREFCAQFSLESSEVAVIGDTVVDMEFGRAGKAGYCIAVLTGSGDKEGLSAVADAVYPGIRNILSDPILFP